MKSQPGSTRQPEEETVETLDVIVIGGGPAGLQAALTLGRMHRRTLLLDAGAYRNDAADAMHNLIGHDGQAPAAFRAAARADLAAYADVSVRDAHVDTVAQEDDRFVVEVAGERLAARRLVLATGLRDTLPAHPGLRELFGDVVAHCPYCHGHEFAGKPVAVLGTGPHAGRVALLMRSIASRLMVLTDGGDLDPATSAVLAAAGVETRHQPVTGICRSPLGARVSFVDGPEEDLGGIFVATETRQAAPFAEQLGLELQPSGCVTVDPMGRTSLPRVYAAGDLAHTDAFPMPLASVLTAAAAGLVAATALDADLLAAEHALPGR
jgi:thioredoxin reductase